MSKAACRCGETAIDLTGAPLESAICYCESCRTAARGFEQAPGAPQTVRADGGVEYCMYRKDRMAIVKGAQHLREHRLKPASPTRRVVAGCCDSPMFADYTPGHWVSVYRARLPDAPVPRVSLSISDRLEGVEPQTGIPAYNSLAPRLMIKLLGSWAAMRFRRPKITW